MRDNQLDDLTLYTFTNRRTEPEPGSVSQISEGSKQLELFDYKKIIFYFLFHSLAFTYSHTYRLIMWFRCYSPPSDDSVICRRAQECLCPGPRPPSSVNTSLYMSIRNHIAPLS